MSSEDQLAGLMAAQRVRFEEVRRPILPDPPPMDVRPFQHDERQRRKRERSVFSYQKRKQLRTEIDEVAQTRATAAWEDAQNERQVQQVAADAWWNALIAGDRIVLTAALKAAFADNAVVVVEAEGATAVVVLGLPSSDVLPKKKAHVTPTGRVSSRAWTKSELNDAYSDLLGAHLLATIREAWAVAPSLDRLRVVGARSERESRSLGSSMLLCLVRNINGTAMERAQRC